MTLEEQLDSINKAIEAIQSGAQEYSIGSRRVRKADYKVLCEERRQIQYQISNRDTGITVATFTGR